jgi:hypothetical protein
MMLIVVISAMVIIMVLFVMPIMISIPPVVMMVTPIMNPENTTTQGEHGKYQTQNIETRHDPS